MRASLFALPALLALAAAQTELTGLPLPSSTETASQEPEASATATLTQSGAVGTATACAEVASLVQQANGDSLSVEAELAHSCLLSVPFVSDAASQTIQMLQRMAQEQSTIVNLKNPPSDYFNDPVDILKGLQDIQDKIDNEKYADEFTFETDIATLFTKAHDGHFVFNGNAFNGAFRWRRSSRIALISGSQDGGLPKVWARQDFNKSSATFTPSAVSEINDENVVSFLGKEALLSNYHDPDTRWNAMFYMQNAESSGYFTNPRFYPGPTTKVKFENGTEATFLNAAIVSSPEDWGNIEDGTTFYQTYIVPQSSSFKKRELKKRDPSFPPTLLEHPRELEFGIAKRSVPASFPKPFIAHSSPDVPLAGYFIGDYGVLLCQTFSTDDSSSAQEFQSVIEQFIAEGVSRGTKKIIVDVRENGGGKIFLGYDAFKQFFPTEDPQLQSRYRASDMNDLLGEKISTLPFKSSTGELFTSPFNFHSYDDANSKPFTSWDDMLGPTTFNGDQFTNLLRYNLSNPLTSTSDAFSIGVTVTGYLDRANFTKQPFDAADIAILSDGICASTCSLFTELMHIQAGVRTFAIGGRPQYGPMQPVGGTKGSLVLQSSYLASLSSVMVNNFATTNKDISDWRKFLLGDFGINFGAASVNFQDNIRKGDEKAGVPTQFVNDTASCRMWMTPQMYMNVTAVWDAVADAAWGDKGAMDETKCVSGSGPSQQAAASSAAGITGTAKPTSTKSGSAAAGLVVPPVDKAVYIVLAWVGVSAAAGMGMVLW